MRRFSAIISLLMLLFVGFRPTKGASSVLPQTDSLPLRRGVWLTTEGQKRLLIDRNGTSADSLFRLSIAEDSTYAPAYFMLARRYSERSYKHDSILYFSRKAYELDSLNKWYSDNYAQALAVSGHFEESRRLYAKAVERTPQDPAPYIMMAMLYQESKLPYSAIAILDSAELKSGRSSYLSSLKRDLLLKTGQRDRAISEAVELTKIDPSNIEDRIVLAQLYSATKQDSLSEVEYKAALAIDTTNLETLNSLSQFYAQRNNYAGYLGVLKRIFAIPDENPADKVASFKRLTTDNKFYATYFFTINELASSLWLQYPNDKSVVELYASHLIASGNLEKALELYKSHTEDRPAEYDYFKSVIDIESYLQRPDSVELYSTRAIELFPTRHELRLSQANLLSYSDRHTEAIKSYEKALDYAPTDSVKSMIWGYIGDNYHQISLDESASKARRTMRKCYRSYDKALKLFRANPLVLNNYAYFKSLEDKDLESALEMSSYAVSLTKNNTTYLDTQAWVLHKLGRNDEAKKIMRQAIALDSTQSAELPFHYAEILAALGEDFMAEIYYEKAQKLGYDEAIITEKIAQLKR